MLLSQKGKYQSKSATQTDHDNSCDVITAHMNGVARNDHIYSFKPSLLLIGSVLTPKLVRNAKG